MCEMPEKSILLRWRLVDKNMCVCSQDLEELHCMYKKKSHFHSFLYRIIKKVYARCMKQMCCWCPQGGDLSLASSLVSGVEEWLVEVGFFSTNLLESDSTPFWHLSWQTQLFSLQHFCDIQIEEIAVQNGLHNSSHYSDHVKEALKVEPPNPVDEV